MMPRVERRNAEFKDQAFNTVLRVMESAAIFVTRDVGFEPPTFHRMRRVWWFEIHGSEMGVRDRDMHGMVNLYRVTC